MSMKRKYDASESTSSGMEVDGEPSPKRQRLSKSPSKKSVSDNKHDNNSTVTTQLMDAMDGMDGMDDEKESPSKTVKHEFSDPSDRTTDRGFAFTSQLAAMPSNSTRKARNSNNSNSTNSTNNSGEMSDLDYEIDSDDVGDNALPADTSEKPNNDNNDKNGTEVNYKKYQKQFVHDLKLEGCVHKVAFPPNISSAEDAIKRVETPLPAYKPAKTFKYDLDIFQSQSCDAIERNDNVLVAAHTSAGKTTVAKYAIAKALKKNQRVIYTSPIKALSNQKYRELSEEFFDVGLMTGDTTINRTAGCLVMTTEILKNMLYRGAEMIREISWVVFDEIHYMRDKDRGVVWEETLILLPRQSRFVFLSATIPNSVEFAKWIAKINGNACHVIYTEMRPVPLQHYMFPSGGDGIYLVVDYKGQFKEGNFQKALNKMKFKESGDEEIGMGSRAIENGNKSKKGKQKYNQQRKKDCHNIVKMIMEREFDPCIVFAFAKRDVEDLAMSLAKLDFCNDDEKQLIARIFNNAIATLSDDDKKLPQLTSLINLLQRGIGIHHAGLLPILKEIVEILFGEGLIKVLFATETFAMGVNFPAKCVIFSNVRKWDGVCRRLLTSGEYVQMSGRAGRRGLDEKGIVIMMVDDKLEPFDVQRMLRGQADRLISQFHLTYPMLIQLMRLEDSEPSYLIQRSFMQFQILEKTPQLRQRLRKLQNELDGKISDSDASGMKAIASGSNSSGSKSKVDEEGYDFQKLFQVDEAVIEEYYRLQMSYNALQVKCRKFTNQPKYLVPWLNPGRIVHVSQPLLNKDWSWGVIINFKKLNQAETTALQRAHNNPNLRIEYLVDVLLRCHVKPSAAGRNDKDATARSNLNQVTPAPFAEGSDGSDDVEYRIIPVQLHHIERLSQIRMNMGGRGGAASLRTEASRRMLGQRLDETVRRCKEQYEGEIPLIDPIEDMKIREKEFAQLAAQMETCEDQMKSHAVHNHPELERMFEKYCRKMEIVAEMKGIEQEIVSLENNEHIDKKLKGMNRVLKRLQMIDVAAAAAAAASKNSSNSSTTSSNDVIGADAFKKGKGVVTRKGRIACEISCGDELVVTELLFGNMFDGMEVAHVNALLSCFLFDEKVKRGQNGVTRGMNDEMVDNYNKLKSVIQQVGEVSKESKLSLNVKEYVEKFGTGLMEVCYAWTEGAKFAEIMKMTPVYEGSIVRVIRRLFEFLDELIQASRLMGNEKLTQTFEACKQSIYRDIIFANSLYLAEEDDA